MSSTSSNTQNVPGPAISSNFNRRIHVVRGCCKFQNCPPENRKGCARQWLSSLIQAISEAFFLECKSLSCSPFETGSRLSRLEDGAFSSSGLTSIHLPASVTVIGAYCFSYCASLASITFESGSQLSELAKEAFCGSGRIVCHSSIRPILLQIFDEMGEVTPSYKSRLPKVPVSKPSTKKRDSEVRCCFTQASSSRRGGLTQISFAEWQSSQQIPRMSAERRGGIECDRRK
jgi:hypothetical protein